MKVQSSILEEAEILTSWWWQLQKKESEARRKHHGVYFKNEDPEKIALLEKDWRKKEEITDLAFMDVMRHFSFSRRHRRFYLGKMREVENDMQSYKNNPLWHAFYNYYDLVERELRAYLPLVVEARKSDEEQDPEFFLRYLKYLTFFCKCPDLISRENLKYANEFLSFFPDDQRMLKTSVRELKEVYSKESQRRESKRGFKAKEGSVVEQANRGRERE